MNQEISDQLEEAFANEFMKPEITCFRNWFKADTQYGIMFFPQIDFSDVDVMEITGCDKEDIETIGGYGARLSASGYLDATDWTVFQTVDEAGKYLLEMYANA